MPLGEMQPQKQKQKTKNKKQKTTNEKRPAPEQGLPLRSFPLALPAVPRLASPAAAIELKSGEKQGLHKGEAIPSGAPNKAQG
jgi:hypothetical protein